jgi:hypothetical protein
MSDLLDEVIAARRAGTVRTDLRKAAAVGEQVFDKIATSPLDYVTEAEKIFGKKTRGFAVKPLLALGLASGFLTLSGLAGRRRTAGVEDDVVDRFKTEYIMGGRRTDEEWASSGLNDRVRSLYRDLSGIAPDVAANPTASLAAIRTVVQRPVSNFTEQEVKALIDTQKSLRDQKPLGGAMLAAVAPLFKLID